MWIKIFSIEYILWKIFATKSMFDVANMLKKIDEINQNAVFF